MNQRNPKISIFLTVIMVLFVSIACTLTRPEFKVGPLQTESRSIELDGAEVIRTEIEIGAGELDVNGGAADLLQADFKYNVAELKPEVNYSADKLSILTPETEGMAAFWDLDDYENEWDLSFNDTVSMEMKIFLGAGRANLKVGDLTLTSLDIDTGAGEVNLDLQGSSALTRLTIDAGVSAVTVDLTGDWQTNLDADIKAGVGDLTLLLPQAACVRVEVEGGISNTNTTGLTKDGDVYINPACDQSDVTLRIDINAGIGNINLNLDN